MGQQDDRDYDEERANAQLLTDCPRYGECRTGQPCNVTQCEALPRSGGATLCTVTDDEGHYLSSDIRRIIGDSQEGRTYVFTKDGGRHAHPFGAVFVWETLEDFRAHS